MNENEIYVNNYFNYYPSASEECRWALYKLGYNRFSIIGYRGSHHADIYFFEEDEEKFKENLLGKSVISGYRKFYFSNNYNSFGDKLPYYSVGYSKKYK